MPVTTFIRRRVTALAVATLAASLAAPLGAQTAGRAPLKSPPTVDSLDAISYRGYLLAQYDAASWIASDSVMARRPDPALIQGYVARQVGDRWEVAFGRVSPARDTFFVAYEARQRAGDRRSFDVEAFTPVRADTGYYLRAARAIAVARERFGPQVSPYNAAVIDRPNGLLWVYLTPAQTKAGVYPLGADVRYLFSTDGRTILATRQLHKALIEYAPRPNAAGRIEAGTHTAILDDIPEDTDVLHVLVRRPRVAEYIVTDAFMYEVSTTGAIRLIGRRPDGPGGKAEVP